MSGHTMRSDGCTLTCVAMVLNTYGYQIDPGQLCDLMNQKGGFTSEGLLIWSVVTKYFPNAVFTDSTSGWTTRRKDQVQKVEIGTALEWIRNLVGCGMPVMINVDNIGNDGIQDHFVVVYDAPATGPWRIKDPDGGLDLLLAPGHKYGPPELAIYGLRTLIGPSLSRPDYVSPMDLWKGLGCWESAMVLAGKSVPTYSQQIYLRFANQR